MSGALEELEHFNEQMQVQDSLLQEDRVVLS